MKNENTVDELNRLVEINNDRIEGYEKAAENTEERDLIELFSKFKQTSKKCLGELISEITKSGGKATQETTTSGKFFRTWMDVKSALTGKDRKAILNSCEYGEENAVEVYNEVLDDNSEHLDLHQKKMIKAQLSLIKADQRTIKSMKNQLVQATP